MNVKSRKERRQTCVPWPFRPSLPNPCFHAYQIHWVFKERQVFQDAGSLDLIFTWRHMDTVAQENCCSGDVRGLCLQSHQESQLHVNWTAGGTGAMKEVLVETSCPSKISQPGCGLSSAASGSRNGMQNLFLQKKKKLSKCHGKITTAIRKIIGYAISWAISNTGTILTRIFKLFNPSQCDKHTENCGLPYINRRIVIIL